MELIPGAEIIGGVMLNMTKPFYVVNNNPDGTKTLAVVPHDYTPEGWQILLLPLQTPVVADTLPELMVKFNDSGYVMPELDRWDHPNKPMRIELTDNNIVSLLVGSEYFRGFIDTMKEFTVSRNGWQLIYLEMVEDADNIALKEMFPKTYNLTPRP